MNRAGLYLGLVAFSLAGGACARNPSPGGEAVSQQSEAAPHNGRWSGSFQPQRSRVGELAPTNRRNSYGTVSIIPLNGNPGRVRIRIDMNSDERFATHLAWGIYRGRCGSGAALASPVIPPAALEKVNLVNGKAQLLTDVGLELNPRTQYHINMFRDVAAADQSAVIACANLRAD